MGSQKDKEIEADDQWQSTAASKGYKCARCGNLILREEYPAWAETKFCSYCQHLLDKDD